MSQLNYLIEIRIRILVIELQPPISVMQNKLPFQSEHLTKNDDDMEITDEDKCCDCGCFSPSELEHASI